MDELELLSLNLKEAKMYELELEVIHWALLSMKENPEQSVVEAIENGMNEWIK